ncbi:glycoside hydrolase family 2 [Bifidobacterium aemilianum]|uniref:Glycoside hydrolase family 2 n=1 Tax=Bifidobacterium aemilianum TaxID=2493120 RepID=A0A366K6E3_9BIFI|nr:glycoside hydrolase family 2 TIM barrel-domain containing protein [Bifidobacterium aemilianum]RBP97315.1 glycoside hydrolase family 2 [Bifidobacterium aemilianum]
MLAINFNQGWAYRHLDLEDEAFRPVTLPHDAMLEEPREADAPSASNSGWFLGRDYEYVKRFMPDDAWRGQSLLLEFEGVYREAEVWVNGRKLAYRPYGYSNFYVDLSEALVFGECNEIRVVARNADQPNSRWYSGAGIYRPVTLWAGHRDHIEVNGISVRTLSIAQADAGATQGDWASIEVAVETSASGSLQLHIDQADRQGGKAGHEVTVLAADQSASRQVFKVRVNRAALWSPEDPQLYHCRVDYVSEDGQRDSDQVDFGIRTLEWGRQGLLLNGRRTILQGACIHHDNGLLGACAFPEAEERKIRLLKANGYNAIRSAHNPCSKALLAACDRQGMLVMDEYIDHWYIHKTQYDYVPHFKQYWRQDLQDMVAKDRNHPSVIMYSIGNEVGETAQKRGIALTGQMVEHIHSLDNGRPVTCGINIFFNFLNSIGLGVYSDRKARKAASGQAGKHQGRRRKAVGSQFFNDMAGLLGADFMKTGAMLPWCDTVTRGAFARLDVAGYNYGIKRYVGDLRRYPDRLILGSETFCSDAYRFRELAKRTTRLIGDFVWAGMDYLGETAVGAWEYSDYASLKNCFGWLTAGSGRLDLTGRPLGEALYTRVALEAENGPYLAVRPVNHTGDKHSPSAWKMTNAIDSWSWEGCEGRPADVEVYARAASVRLLLNGREVGQARLRGDCKAEFRIIYQPGSLEALAYDKQGKLIGRRSLQSAGPQTKLSLEPERHDVRSGGMAFIRVSYSDESGIVKPLRRGRLTATVDGGELLAFGCAAPFNRGNFQSVTTATYCGEALAVVRASRYCARLSLQVNDGRLRGQVDLKIQPGDTADEPCSEVWPLAETTGL